MLLKILILTAAFEARDAVIIGKQVFQATDDWREPIANYTIESNTDVDIQAGRNITLKPGTSIKTGSRCRLHMQNDFNCAQAQFRLANNNAETDDDVAPYTEEFVKSFVPESKTFADLNANELVLNVYPNPSNLGIFKIVLNSDNIKINDVQVFDCTGKLIIETTNLNSSECIDLTTKPKGIYLLKILVDTHLLTKKIIYE